LKKFVNVLDVSSMAPMIGANPLAESWPGAGKWLMEEAKRLIFNAAPKPSRGVVLIRRLSERAAIRGM
jgi:hypothetical protein